MADIQVAFCPHCDTEAHYTKKSLRMSPMRALRCGHCTGYFKPEEEAVRKGKTDNQTRSQTQEKRLAKVIGGRSQPGSGSRRGAKGDVRAQGKVRGECKFTRAASFSLKLAELHKIRKEAKGEMPIFHIEFQGVYPVERFVVLSEDDYRALRGDSDDE